MLVRHAKSIARQWVEAEAGATPGFRGALLHGSAAWLADDADLPDTSDVDVLVVIDGPLPDAKPGKFRHRGVLLEVSYLPLAEVRSAEQVLAVSHLAGSLRAPGVLADPTGHLSALHTAVAREFAHCRWVRARCEHVVAKLERNLASLDAPAPLHDHVMAWLFAAGLTTHVLLVAGLRNPTVRQRYVAARELLAEYGRAEFHEELLALLGCADMSPARAAEHLAALEAVFDAAKGVIRTPFFFAADISDDGRPVAIDGSRALIESGLHREAVFWIAATSSRCQKVLHDDAPELLARFAPGYAALRGDLDVAAPEDLRRRGAEVRAFLPRLWQVAEEILAANPAIEDD